MLEPEIAFQTTVRAALIGDPVLLALLPARAIGAGCKEPAMSPTIVLGDAATTFLGHAAGGQLLARVFLTLHIWAPVDGADTAKAIGTEVLRILATAPFPEDLCALEEFEPPAVTWLDDADPARAWTHGAMELSGMIRWRP